MMLRFGIGAFLFSILLNAPIAHAAPTCSDLFSNQILSRARVQFLAPNAEIKSVLQVLRAPRFEKATFDTALAVYRSTESQFWPEPRTREAKLALVEVMAEVMAEKSGHNPFEIEESVSKTIDADGDAKGHAAALAKLSDSLGRIDLSRGFSPVQIETIYLKLYNYSHFNPRTVSGLRKLGVSGVERELLRQWVDKELASQSFPKAVEKLGFLRTPNAREKFITRMRQHPNLIATAHGAAIGLFQNMMMGSIITLPSYSKLASTRLSPELRELMLKGGFDAAYPALKARYGKAANFDHAFFWARRTATTALMGIFLFHFYPTTLQTILPPGYASENATAVELTKDVVTYYSQVVVRLAGQTPKNETSAVTPASSTGVPPRARLQLQDGAPVSTDPPPVAVVPVPAIEPSANQPIPQNLIDAAEASVPNPEANPEELEQLLNDLNEIDFSETAPS